MKKSTRRSHFDAYTGQIVKSSINHQTTEMPSKPSFDMFQVFFLTLIPRPARKVKKGTRRSHFDACTRQIVKISVYHQTTET